MSGHNRIAQKLGDNYANAHVYAAIVAILESSVLRGPITYKPAERILAICRKEIRAHFAAFEDAEAEMCVDCGASPAPARSGA